VVRTPQAARLREALQAQGAGVQVIAADRLEISGSTVEQVATLAAARGLPVFEISAQADSLEEAFLRVTSAAGRPR
jgi:ABC-2 type transport system ATP-binding protein